MKTIIGIITTVTLLVATTAHINGVSEGKSLAGTESIQIMCSPDLLDIARTWVQEYTTANPEAEISVTGIPDEGLKDLNLPPGTIGLFSKNYLSDLPGEDTWKIVVGRYVVVPVMNPENPYREEVLQMGISPEEFAKLFTGKDEHTWGMLLNNKHSDPVTPCFVGDQSTRSYLAEFLQIDQQNIQGKETESPGEAYVFTLTGNQPWFSIKLKDEVTLKRIGIGDLDGDGAYDFVLQHPDYNVDPYYRPGY